MKHIIIPVCLVWMALVTVRAQEPDFDWMSDVGAHSYPASTKIYNVADYGAKGDAVMLCTKAIQKAIDECHAGGGGIVTFLPGIYLTGSIFIKSNVDFRIPKGASDRGQSGNRRLR